MCGQSIFFHISLPPITAPKERQWIPSCFSIQNNGSAAFRLLRYYNILRIIRLSFVQEIQKMEKKDFKLGPVKEKFLDRCFELVENAVEDKKVRMKDVARSLGISSQVASKVVNPSDSRTLTAFELFRMSVLLRKPATELIPPEMYLTPEEMNDADLCRILGGTGDSAGTGNPLSAEYSKLPAECRHCAMRLLRAMGPGKKARDDGPCGDA